MPRALVLGGTGHIGAAIARQLHSAGYEVTASGRTASPRPNLAGIEVSRVGGDDRQPGTLAAWVPGHDLVVDAATPYPLWRHGGEARVSIRAALTRTGQLLDVVARHAARLIHVSSFTTLPPSGRLSDQMRLATVRGLHPYFELKDKVEREVLHAIDQGLDGSVINPSACFGPYDPKPAELAYVPMLLQGKVSGTVRHPINIVDVRDVAEVVGKLASEPAPPRQVPVFGHNVHVDDLTRQICTLAGVAPPRLRAPLAIGLMASYWAESAAALTGRKSPWPSLPILLTGAGRAMPPSPAQAALGQEVRPLAQTLQDSITWYQSLQRPVGG